MTRQYNLRRMSEKEVQQVKDAMRDVLMVLDTYDMQIAIAALKILLRDAEEESGIQIEFSWEGDAKKDGH